MNYFHPILKKYIYITDKLDREIKNLQSKEKLLYWQAYDKLDITQLKKWQD